MTAEDIFNISVDVANFHQVLPKYFQSLKIIKDEKHEKIVIEKISFLGFSSKIKTKHVMLPPNLHHVYILNGPLKGSSFIESYNPLKIGTEIIIDVHLKFFGFFSGFNFLNNYIADKMHQVMNEFITSVEAKINKKLIS
jgi:hypothetical protein